MTTTDVNSAVITAPADVEAGTDLGIGDLSTTDAGTGDASTTDPRCGDLGTEGIPVLPLRSVEQEEPRASGVDHAHERGRAREDPSEVEPAGTDRADAHLAEPSDTQPTDPSDPEPADTRHAEPADTRHAEPSDTHLAEPAEAHPADARPKEPAVPTGAGPAGGATALATGGPVQPLEPHPFGGALLGDPGSLVGMRPAAPRQPTGQAIRRRHDLECEAFTIGGLHVAAASLRGLSHTWDGRPNQDAFFVGLSEDEQWVIAVVADGVSSATLADLAADAAARETWAAVRRALVQTGDPDLVDWTDLVDQVQRRMLAHGQRLVAHLAGAAGTAEQLAAEAVSPHFAATAEVLLVATSSGPDGDRRMTRVRLAGDASCYLLTDGPAGPAWSVLSSGKDLAATVASNTVRPLPLPQPAPATHTGTLREGTMVALVSDGIADPMADGTTLTGRHLAAQWRQPLSATQFLASCTFVVTGGEDDRTAVVMWA